MIATLEEALQVRLDFRWLVEGRSIDHTTISEFRRKHADALKQTFVQIALVAREIGCLPLQKLAFDGTRIRSNNRRRGTRTPAELREMKQAFAVPAGQFVWCLTVLLREAEQTSQPRVESRRKSPSLKPKLRQRTRRTTSNSVTIQVTRSPRIG